MGVFASYTLRSLRKNRTRTVVTVIGVILSTALLTGVVATATSVAAALLGRTIETEGSWQVYDSLQPAEADSALGRLATETNVATAMDSRVAGFASYASDADLSTTLLAIQTAPQVLRGGADQARSLTVMPTVRSGREPEAPGEIMLPVTFSGVTLADDGSGASATSDGPIELGSTVTLPLGAALGDGDSLGTPTTTRGFTVVGFYVPQHFLRNDFTAFEEAGTTAIVSPNDVSNPVFTRVWVSTSGLSTRDALKGWAAPHLWRGGLLPPRPAAGAPGHGERREHRHGVAERHGRRDWWGHRGCSHRDDWQLILDLGGRAHASAWPALLAGCVKAPAEKDGAPGGCGDWRCGHTGGARSRACRGRSHAQQLCAGV